MSACDTPWICPSCAHFIVRADGPTATPSHECKIAGESVEFVPYVDSDQALQIRNKIGTTPDRHINTRSI